MTSATGEIVRRARLLVGVPFRPQGRNPRIGLDCVGIVMNVFEIPADAVRRDYRLRGPHLKEMDAALVERFGRAHPRETRAGDVMLCVIRADQMHLAIHCGSSFVHADARLRQVVETPGEPPWPIAAVFRPARSSLQSS